MKSLEQSYNCQAAVDAKAQIIVAGAVIRQSNDKQQVAPMVDTIKGGAGGKILKKMSADTGYYSKANLNTLESESIDAYILTGRVERTKKPVAVPGRISKGLSIKVRMARKLWTLKGRETYSRREKIIEPVFRQIKEARSFRCFSFRGLVTACHEWNIVCLMHNLLKPFCSGFAPVRA